MDINAPGLEGLLAWVKKYQPAIYKDAAKHLPTLKLNGLGITTYETDSGSTTVFDDPAPSASSSTTSGAPSTLDVIKNAVMVASQAYLTKTQLDAQGKILNMQLDRLRNGLPVVDMDPSQYGVPSVALTVGKDTKTFAYIALAGVGLFAFFMMMGRRRT
jgi:hypothetical protein